MIQMGCCSQTRRPLSDRHQVKVRYGGGRPIVVRGPVTGRDYRFSGLERLQLVDPRDALVLMRSPLLRIEGVVELPMAAEEASGNRGGGDA